VPFIIIHPFFLKWDSSSPQVAGTIRDFSQCPVRRKTYSQRPATECDLLSYKRPRMMTFLWVVWMERYTKTSEMPKGFPRSFWYHFAWQPCSLRNTLW
jgi:hypothetical protein